MGNQLPDELQELVWEQRGVLTARQALAGGMTRDMIRERLERGKWQRLQTGVYAVFSGPPGRPAVMWAAVLRAGPTALLSYNTAAELWKLSDRRMELIHVTVGGRRPEGMAGVVLHRAGRAEQTRHPAAGPPRTRIEETVLDLAVSARNLDEAYGWISAAVGRGLTRQHLLAEAMGLRAKVRWRRELGEMLGVEEAGVHSLLEHRYLRDVERPHGLPHGVRQALVRLAGRNQYRDVLYEEYLVAVELDGEAAHPADRRWPDIKRDNAAAESGVITLRYGWLDVTRHPCQVAAQVAAVLAQRGGTGYRGCSAGCPVRITSAAQAKGTGQARAAAMPGLPARTQPGRTGTTRRPARPGQPGQGSQARAARPGQPGQGSQARAARPEHRPA
jgi:hypothetical protein